MSNRWPLLLFLLLFGINLLGQAVTFYAETDARQIIAGNYFEVSFTIENAQGESFTPPDFAPFELMSGPNRSSQMSIVNGQMSQKMTFSYGLTATKPGKYTIKSAKITAGGKSYQSNPVEIEVLKGSDVKSNNTNDPNIISSDDFIVVAELSYDTAFIGQQLTLKYVLYTTKDIRSYNFAEIPQFDGFFAQEIQGFRDRPERIIKNGIQYVSRTLKVIALFPQQKGKFVISPAKINLGISTQSSHTSFFFNSNLKPVRVQSDEVQVYVSDLPTNKLQSFAGAVGDFYLGSAVDRNSLALDDALTLTYQIKGDGDSKLILAPDQPFTDLFDIYDPNLLAEESNVSGDKIITTKTYEYLMIPKKEGTLSFRPELSFYNVERKEYTTIQGETYTVNVTPSTGRQRADLGLKKIEYPPIFTTTELKPKGKFFLYSKPYWIANGVLGLGFIGLLIAKKIQIDKDNIDPTAQKHSKAKKVAISQLTTAKKAWEQGQTKEFYIQLRKGLLEYLSSKTFRNSAQMSKHDISELLAKHELIHLEGNVLDIMNQGEMAIYANMNPGNEGLLYEKAINLIESIESSLKK